MPANPSRAGSARPIGSGAPDRRSGIHFPVRASIIAALMLAPSLVAACSRGDAAGEAGGAARTDSSAAAASTPIAAAASATSAASAAGDTISEQADRGRIMGDSSATVWLIMASDFQCPFCKEWHDAQFAGIVRDYVATGRVRAAFVNFPLSQHRAAVPAAEAAMCAGVQGKFWPLHDGLFAAQHRWEASANPTPIFDSLAARAGVDLARYHECVNKHLTIPMIGADHERARQWGAKSTPTFFVGDQILMGANANVRGALDAALAGRKPANAGPPR